jgi:predicted HTH domain antitoxin
MIDLQVLLDTKTKGSADMSHTIQIELADDILLGMQRDDRAMAAELRLAAAVKWYECEMLSQERAAAVAGLSRAEFIAALSRFGVSPFQETVTDVLNTLK